MHEPGTRNCSCTCCVAFARVFGIPFGLAVQLLFGRRVDPSWTQLTCGSLSFHIGFDKELVNSPLSPLKSRGVERGRDPLGREQGLLVEKEDPVTHTVSPAVAQPESPPAAASGSVPEIEVEDTKNSKEKKKDRDRRRRRSPVEVKKEPEEEDTAEPLVKARAEERSPLQRSPKRSATIVQKRRNPAGRGHRVQNQVGRGIPVHPRLLKGPGAIRRRITRTRKIARQRAQKAVRAAPRRI